MSTTYDEDGEESGPVVVEGIENEPQRVVSHTPTSQRIELQPADFLFGKTLGEGAFARVVHARSKRAGTDFAIKIMEKRHIKKENKVSPRVCVPTLNETRDDELSSLLKDQTCYYGKTNIDDGLTPIHCQIPLRFPRS